MKCERCGYSPLPNPLKAGVVALNWWMMLWFFDHMTPAEGSWLGAENFFINWHWYMWWFAAILGGLTTFFFAVFSIMWISDPDGYYKHSRS